MDDYRFRMAAAAPYFILTLIQLCLACFLAILRSAVASASATVIVVYQQILSSLVLSALAFLFDCRESQGRPRMGISFKIVAWSFLIALLQIPLGELMLTGCLRYVTEMFSSVALNIVPMVVFVLAVACGRERFRFWSVGGQAKLWATVVAAVGATVVVLTTVQQEDYAGLTATGGGQVLGITMVGVAVLAEASASVAVERVALSYDGDLTLSALVAIFGTLQVAVFAAFTERDLSAWRIQWSGSLELFTILYGGILVTGLAYFGRIWCIHMKGPVFCSAFFPLLVVFSFIIQVILYGAAAQLGSIIGSVLVVVGLYVLLWAKAKHDKVEKIIPKEHNLPDEASSAAEYLLPAKC